MGRFFFGIKGKPKFALQNFEVGGVLLEKMHTPETKKYHFFQKNSHFMFTSEIRGPNFI